MHPESWMPRFKWDLMPFPCRLQFLAVSTLWSDFQALPCSGIERGTCLCSSVLVSVSEPLVWAASLVFVQVLSWFGKTQLRSHLCSLSALWWHLWLEFSKLIGACHCLKPGCPVSRHIVNTLPSHAAPAQAGPAIMVTLGPPLGNIFQQWEVLVGALKTAIKTFTHLGGQVR